MEKLSSRENAKVKYACSLASSGAFRRAEGRFHTIWPRGATSSARELCRGANALETLFCAEAALEKCRSFRMPRRTLPCGRPCGG